jgi:hypothetical protein
MAWPNGLAFVAVQIVHHHQLVRPERGNEHFLDVGAEAFAVDRTVDEPRRLDAVVAKRGDEGHGFPMAVGNFGDEPLAAPRPASQRLHVGLRPRLVDEHQTLGVDPALTQRPWWRLLMARKLRVFPHDPAATVALRVVVSTR